MGNRNETIRNEKYAARHFIISFKPVQQRNDKTKKKWNYKIEFNEFEAAILVVVYYALNILISFIYLAAVPQCSVLAPKTQMCFDSIYLFFLFATTFDRERKTFCERNEERKEKITKRNYDVYSRRVLAYWINR